MDYAVLSEMFKGCNLSKIELSRIIWFVDWLLNKLNELIDNYVQ